MVSWAGCGHPGGSLSATDIITTLYFNHMRFNAKNPQWPNRDRFVLSKGHCSPLLYAILAQAGYFDRSMLRQFRQLGSPLQGHPDRCLLPGVEMSTGSLGQGLSIAHGMALSMKYDRINRQVYALLGDGEIQEGMIWEAAMSAAHYGTDNLCAILDLNGIQIDGFTKDIMNPEPIASKWQSFGWHTMVIDGHQFDEIDRALDQAISTTGCPSIIIAKTIKGKGVSYMEHSVEYHGSAPNAELSARALEELDKA